MELMKANERVRIYDRWKQLFENCAAGDDEEVEIIFDFNDSPRALLTSAIRSRQRFYRFFFSDVFFFFLPSLRTRENHFLLPCPVGFFLSKQISSSRNMFADEVDGANSAPARSLSNLQTVIHQRNGRERNADSVAPVRLPPCVWCVCVCVCVYSITRLEDDQSCCCEVRKERK